MLAKVARSRPDAVIVDLEERWRRRRRSRRGHRDERVAAQRPGADRVLLRINGVGTPWYGADVTAAGDRDRGRSAGRRGAAQVRAPGRARAAVGRAAGRGAGDRRVGERARRGRRPDLARRAAGRGVLRRRGLHRRPGRPPYPGGHEVLYARSQVCLAARWPGSPRWTRWWPLCTTPRRSGPTPSRPARSLPRQDLPAPEPGRHRARGVTPSAAEIEHSPRGTRGGRRRRRPGRRPDGLRPSTSTMAHATLARRPT